MGGFLNKYRKLAIALAAGTFALPAAAQQPPMTVSAADPEGMANVLRFAGYPAEVVTDDYGDPQIDTEFSGWEGVIMFYGCDEETHDGCDSIELRVGFDRKEPMTLELLNEVVASRFIAAFLDDEGDPWINWDIITGNDEGIPAPVFMQAVNEFSSGVEYAADLVFAEESEKGIDFDAPEERPAETI
jgi:hypothetical protein